MFKVRTRSIIVMLILAFVMFGTANVTKTPVSEITVVQAEANLASHPRFFFDAVTLPSVRAKANGSHSEIWQAISGYITKALEEDLPPTNAPASGGLSTYRDNGNKMTARVKLTRHGCRQPELATKDLILEL